MADTAELRAALAEAVEESKFPTTDDAVAASWDNWENEGGAPLQREAPAAAAADGDEPSKDEAPDDPQDPETAEAQGDLPDEYWGVSLEGIPDEAKQSILDHFAQQDSTIQKLQARLAQEPAAPEPVDEPSDDGEITDEALAIALGYDPEDPYTQPTPKELTMARSVIALEDKVDALIQKDEVEAVKANWNRQLDELEEVQGKLPFDRVQILRYAIEEGIASPFEVYFKLSAPGKREVEQTVAAARREAAKKAEAGGVKPRSSSGDSAPIDPKTTSLRDAVAIAMKESEKETGLSFKDIFGKKKFRSSE